MVGFKVMAWVNRQWHLDIVKGNLMAPH